MIEYTDQARSDLRDAALHYDDIEPDLAAQFLASVAALEQRLELFPSSGTPAEGHAGVRRARLKQFPYTFFYRVEERDDVLVLTVVHAKRRGPDL